MCTCVIQNWVLLDKVMNHFHWQHTEIPGNSNSIIVKKKNVSGEYLQTQCIGVGCGSCEKSHPSCVGLLDGANSYPDRPMTSDYIICDHGRTISTEHCNTGLFDPSTKACRAYSRKLH